MYSYDRRRYSQLWMTWYSALENGEFYLKPNQEISYSSLKMIKHYLVYMFFKSNDIRACLKSNNWPANVPILLILRCRTRLDSAAISQNLRLV